MEAGKPQEKTGVTTQHPQYAECVPLWEKSRTSIKGEHAIKQADEKYLPKTSGQAKKTGSGIGEKQYKAYKNRARFFDLPSQMLGAVLGLVFEAETEYEKEPITNDGLNEYELAINTFKELMVTGRFIHVVEAPSAEEGTDTSKNNAYITTYSAESLINWKVDANNNLTLAVFLEEVLTDPDNDFSHEKEKRYRVYKQVSAKAVEVTVYDEKGNVKVEAQTITRDQLDIFIAGSLDLSPDCDPIPLQPVTDCAISAYQLSADYRHALFLAAQPTPWVSGINKEQWELILEEGIGSSALWWLGGEEGQAGYLETHGVGIAELAAAILSEIKQAETHAVRLTQSSEGVEAAETVAMRAASQHATIHSIAQSVVTVVNKAKETRAKRNGTPFKEFELKIDFSAAQATSQVLTAINQAVSLSNLPKSVLYEAVRSLKLTTKTDEELDDEIAANPNGLTDLFKDKPKEKEE